MTPEQFDDAVWRHPVGFRAVMASRSEEPVVEATARRIVDIAAASTDTVFHLRPRSTAALGGASRRPIWSSRWSRST
jgi:hypothetical protein